MAVQVIEGSYGWCTGPGPYHLLVKGDGGAHALCAVKRINVYRGAVAIERVCPRCLENLRRASNPPPPKITPAEIETALAGIAAALADLGDVRERLSAYVIALRGVNSARLDWYLTLAYRSGYTLAELGKMLGLTRERIRQRIAAASPPDEVA